MIRDIPIKIHYSLSLFVLGYCGVTWWTQGFEAALIQLAFVSVLWLCVLAHEVAHSMAGASFRCHTQQIVLFIFGGGAQMEDLSRLSPWQTCWVSIAGPLMSVLVAITFNDVSKIAYVSDLGLSGFFLNIAVINIILALFNLIPALPMDGGRMFHALVYSIWGKYSADKTAKVFTGILAGVGFGYSAYTYNLILALICYIIVSSVGEAVKALTYGNR